MAQQKGQTSPQLRKILNVGSGLLGKGAVGAPSPGINGQASVAKLLPKAGKVITGKVKKANYGYHIRKVADK